MIKAIDTEYNGYKFRSRLEARVAVFLDAAGALWDYEVEGFALPVNGNYLPDFLVTSFPKGSTPFWLEVKAKQPTKNEIHKLRELCIQTQIPGAFFTGTMTDRLFDGQNRLSVISQHDVDYAGWRVDVFEYIQAPLTEYIEDGDDDSTFWDTYKQKMWATWDMFLEIQDAKYLKPAAKTALSARFEFGESG